MRTIEWTGTLTALSSISHTGKESGINHTFRRETVIGADGKRLTGVPVVSGGVTRGGMRRLAAAMAQQAIAGDSGRLPFTAVHALKTGGSLRETRSAQEVLTGERQAELRDLVPMLAVFGFSAAGRIVSGRLSVDKPLPVARELLHLCEHYGLDPQATQNAPSMWELVQQETYTRFADVTDARAQPYITPETTDTELPAGSGQMLWNQETLPAGTRMFHSVMLSEASPIEVSFMDELMTLWSTRGRLGGQQARGMGRIRGDYQRSCLDVLGYPADPEPEVDWRQHTRDNRDRIMEALTTWL